ncbi:MAG: zinc transporter ZupT [Chloroflexi bacterium]|nr:zinc transporter ZupT [Chloroflexota bacterium]
MGGSVWYALLLSLVAGLSTGIGSLLAIFVRRPGPRFMTITLGFSCGVMVLISFQELLHEGMNAVGFVPAYAAFFGGMVLMLLIDMFIPHEFMAEHREDQMLGVEPTLECPMRGRGRGWGARRGRGRGGQVCDSRLYRLGLCTAIGVIIHNFPEGMASFAGALQDTGVGIAIAVAIALHNIPEGLAVSAPVLAATGSRWQALRWGLLCGMAEPAGAALAALVLFRFLSPTVLGYLLSVVAGIMVFIALDELLPAAHEYRMEHLGVIGVMAGMAVMALSLYLLSAQ